MEESMKVKEIKREKQKLGCKEDDMIQRRSPLE